MKPAARPDTQIARPNGDWSKRHPVLTAALGFGAGSVAVVVLARVLDPYTWRGRPIP